MKIRKTVIFMIQNPSPLFLYFLICWLLFSALMTISDDPFRYGAIPDAMEEIGDWSSALPWSIWKIFNGISIMIEEIVHDISYQSFWIVIIPSLIIGFFEGRSSMIGIRRERADWMNWYDSISDNNQLHEDRLLPNKSDTNNYHSLYFKELPLHILCWMVFFLIVTLIIGYGNRIYNPYFGFFQTILEYSSIFSNFIIPGILLLLLSSYRATRGIIKGVSTERKSWIKWIKQHGYTDNYGIHKPPTESVLVESFFKKVIETVIFILRNPLHLYKQFLVWVIVIPILFFLLCISIWGVGNGLSVRDFSKLFFMFTIPLSIVAYIMCYREAKGRINGIRSEQNFWSTWYEDNQNKTDYPLTDFNNSEKYSENTSLHTIKLTLELILEKPIRIIFYIFGWTVGFVFVYGITDKLFLEGFSDSIQILLILCLAIISYYFETKGFLIGGMNQRRYWIDWLNQKYESGDSDTDSHDTPGILEMC